MPRSGLPKHCSYNVDRHGRRRVRFRRDGFSTYLTGTPWSEDFMRQYAAALDRVAAARANIGTERTVPGSLHALAASYYRSPEFRGLKSSSQRVYRNVIERLRDEHGDKPVAGLRREHVKAIVAARADTPVAANSTLNVLRLLLAQAVEVGMLDANPALGVKRYKTRGEGIHTWSEDEVTRFEARHPVGTKPRLALALLLYTGQRTSDVVRMGRQHMRRDAIAVRQEKTDRPLLIPIHPELRRALEATPRTNMTFLVTEFGRPFSAAGFGNWMRKRCDEAGLPQCSAHGLRKLAATRLADLGCSVHQIMAVTGHRSMSEVARYTRAADQSRLAREAMDTLLGEQRVAESLSNPETAFVQPGKKPR